MSSNGSLPGPSALRLRGGFKARWRQKHIAGLGAKRTGLSALQKQHQV